MKHSIFILLWLFCIPCNSLSAKVKVIGIEILGLHQQDFQGSYDRIINQIVGQDIELKVLSPKRAKNAFNKCQNCCLTPANKDPEFYEYGDDVIQTDPMNTAKIYIFVNTGNPPLTTLEELKGMKVGIRRGMPYGKSVESSNLNFNVVNRLKQNITLLEMGRVSAIIAYVPDLYQVLGELNRKPFPHDKTHPLAIHPDSLICRSVSPKFMLQFNNGLKEMIKKKQLKSILGSTYIAH